MHLHKQKIFLLRDKTFIVYPELKDSFVRWRAAIEVDRFYRTNRTDIRCRRYKGGKALQLSHQGTNDYLKDSWKILQDSLLIKYKLTRPYKLSQKKMTALLIHSTGQRNSICPYNNEFKSFYTRFYRWWFRKQPSLSYYTASTFYFYSISLCHINC